MRQSLQRATGLAGVLRGVVADMQSASGADIVSIFLYEESTRRYYAPFATGQPQESLLDSLADMTEQLGRYADDASHGKVPDDLGVHNWASSTSTTASATRRPTTRASRSCCAWPPPRARRSRRRSRRRAAPRWMVLAG
ncbi:MAG: hypothetical protein E6I42_12715 [Chloroflexi bacterium]|nr:MAG: hypothetical protein E6I42_12715 [Chloroflexota bacterium]